MSTNKKKGFGIFFIFNLINRIISLLRDIIKTQIIGANGRSDLILMSEKYMGIFKAPFCPNHGNFAPLLSTYIKKYKGNNQIIRLFLFRCSVLVLGITSISIVFALFLQIYLQFDFKYLFYILGISPLIYSMFFNAFCMAVLNVHERYTTSSFGVVSGNGSGFIILLIPFILKTVFHKVITMDIMFVVLVLINLSYAIIQSIYLFFQTREFFIKPRNKQKISDEEYTNTLHLQKELLITIAYQSPKAIAELYIYNTINSISKGFISMINLSHRCISSIIICILNPIYNMSYSILAELQGKQFSQQAGNIFMILHLFIFPLLILFNNDQIINFVISIYGNKIDDMFLFARIFRIIAYATYFGSISRIMKNIISVSKSKTALASASFFSIGIQCILVILYLTTKKYNIVTEYFSIKTLESIVQYSISVGDILEFSYLLYHVLKNRLIHLSYNQTILLLISICTCITTAIIPICIKSTIILFIIFTVFAIYNFNKYVNKE